MENTKTCRICKQVLSKASFYKSKRHKDGLRNDCKTCHQAITAANAKGKREKYTQYLRNFKAKNPTRITALNRAYRERNAEAIKTRLVVWRNLNKDKLYIKQTKRRARKEAAKSFLVQIKELKKLRSSPCFYCGSYKDICIDHIIPLSRGGDNSIGNYVPACRSCNSSKGYKFIMEWKKVRGW